jgi:DNA polymerase I
MKSFEEVRQRYVVVDFKNTLWKSWMVKPATGDLTRADGYPSGHIFRMFRTLCKWKRGFGGDLVFCYEGGERLRYEAYPEYKGTRKKASPDEFDPTSDVLRMVNCFKCFDVTPLEAEADDAIAAWVKMYPDANHLILSSDKDLWTLRAPNVQIVSFQDILDDAHVAKSCEKHFGTPNLRSITLAKALYGDSSDNLPKVPRLLKKHVASLLEVAETPDDLFANLEGVPATTAVKLKEFEPQIRKMYEVVSLRADVALDVRSRTGKPNRLRNMLREFECTSLIQDVDFMCS